MKSSLNTKKVWDLLQNDPAHLPGMPDEVCDAYRKVVDALPDILKDQLDAKVTVSSLAQAKMDVVEYALECGFVDTLVASIPEEILPASREEMVAGMKDMFGYARLPLMEMIHNTQEYLEANGINAESALRAGGKGFGLSRKSYAACAAGKLTIRDLLETQPGPVAAFVAAFE